MRGRKRYGFTILVLTTCLSVRNSSAQDPPKDLVHKQYPQKLDALQEKFRQVHGSLTLIESRPNPIPMPATTSSSRIEFWIDGKNRKIIQINDAKIPGDKTTYKRVFCETPELSFYATQRERNGELLLKGVAEKDDLSIQRRIDRLTAPAVKATYSAWGPLPSIMTSPNFHLGDVTSIKTGEQSTYQIQFEHDVTAAGRKLNSQGFVNVLPERAWVLTDYEYRLTKSTVFSGHIDYDFDTPDGIPVPRLVERHSPTEDETFKIVTIEFGPTPLSEFTLMSEGLVSPPKEEKPDAEK